VKNTLETQRWLRDAEACLSTAQTVFSLGDYRATVQNAQLCIELSAKAVIACFAEPVWRHDPSRQLLKLIEEHEGEIEEELSERLDVLADDVQETAPWHGWSVYGRLEPEGWMPAVDLCTEEAARDMLEKATQAFQTASEFCSEL
jgi:HEPN domain-containing protein